MSVPNPEQYAAEVARIESLISWNQELNPADKAFYRDHLLAQWNTENERLAVAKANEMALRTKLVKLCSDPSKDKGTEYVDLANGYRLKMVKAVNYGFVKAADGKKLDKGAVDSALSAIEAADPAGAFIASELVKWEPKLSLTIYDKLEAPLKAIIDKVIVTSPGAPKLEIVPPKGSK